MTAPDTNSRNPGHQASPREIDLRGMAMTQLVEQAQAAIDAARAGESVAVLADNEVVVKYLTPTAATSGVRCRFGPAVDGVWRIDLSPRAGGGPEVKEAT